MALLSIIVPVYKVAPYLKEGLDSVLNQQVQDIEVICVNDGSTDSSLYILNDYALNDKRVKVLSQINRGVSVARNVGIDNASGEYITFFDPDDIVSSDMYERMLEKCISHRLDLIICAFKTSQSDIPVIHDFLKDQKVSPARLISHCPNWHSSSALCFSWRMIFRTELIKANGIYSHPEISIGEDALFNMTVLCHSKNTYYLPEPLYRYRISDSSTMTAKFKPNLERSLSLQFSEQESLMENNKDIRFNKRDFYEDVVKRYTQMLFNNLRNNPNELDKIAGVKKILNMPMIREAMKEVGYRNIYSSWKEYVFYLAMKYRFSWLVYKLFFYN